MNNTEKLVALRDLIGVEQFKVITERFKGEKIYFRDYCGFVSKEERDQAMWHDFIYGMSVGEISDKYGLQTTTVYKVLESKESK